ncbi:MAG TPA: GNAT family N-acetyltransferase [Thermomicrobiales bacterium]
MSRSGATSGADDWFVRPARPADYTAACAIVAASALDRPPLLTNEAVFSEAAATGGVYVAAAAANVIGLLGAQPIAYDGEKPYTLWIEVVAVHRSWRRQGIGSALYRALGQWAERVGIQGALTAYPNNPAVNGLHEQVGFVSHRDDLLLWRFDSRPSRSATR